MTETEKQLTSVYFKGESENVRRFNSNVKLLGLKTKDVYNAFLKKFNESTDEALNFLNFAKTA